MDGLAGILYHYRDTQRKHLRVVDHHLVKAYWHGNGDLKPAINRSQDMAAVSHDFNSLLSKFIQTGSVRFKDFSHVWRQSNFSFIHCIHRDGYFRNKFTCELLSIACEYLSSSYEFQMRIGGLYLLYSLYATQLCVPKVKIRLTEAMYRELNVFQETIRKHNHHDADFILRILQNGKAFLFVAMPTRLCLNSNQIISPSAENESEVILTRNAVSNAIDIESLQNLSEIHEQYDDLKKQIAANATGQLQQDVNVEDWRESLGRISGELIQELIDSVRNYEKQKKIRSEKSLLGSTHTVDNTYINEESTNHFNRRTEIVSAAYSTIKKPNRNSRRSMKEGKDHEEDNADRSEITRQGKRKYRSTKSARK
ncbi:snRNA-activating protein complex subunit 1 [Trichoplax sp. H2]|nr:snRNA-activating protein complex subunit 1 [Trichoplax sp. H2]|eukprot:RDD38771.1 snRNA-activating protein complex subunit 1 [Trichoplax sp. H2]